MNREKEEAKYCMLLIWALISTPVLARTFSVPKKKEKQEENIEVDQKCITVYQIYDEKYV